MNKQIIVPYTEAVKHIKEADVLLFRASNSIKSAGWWITRYTGGIHSHVGLAHWDNDRLFCVEQREFKGGRSVSLASQVDRMPYTIDVYSASPHIWVPTVTEKGDLVEKSANPAYDIRWERISLGNERRAKITETALDLTGTDYGWRNIWEIYKCYVPFWRLVNNAKNGDEDVSRAFVCSTLVTYSYRTHYQDPCPNLSDRRTKPADIAQSSLFSYLFTIGENDAS